MRPLPPAESVRPGIRGQKWECVPSPGLSTRGPAGAVFRGGMCAPGAIAVASPDGKLSLTWLFGALLLTAPTRNQRESKRIMLGTGEHRKGKPGHKSCRDGWGGLWLEPRGSSRVPRRAKMNGEA